MAKSKKVNKWEAAPENIKLLHNAFTAFNTMSYDELDDKVDWDELDGLLAVVLKEYNELEAKHNADCGLISKLEEENKTYETLAAELHNDTDELERTINNLEEMVEFHKGEVKKLVETADIVRDKHENEVCMLKKDISDLQVKVKYYKEDIEDLECEASKYKALYEGLESKLDSVTRERNHAEYTLSQLIEQLKIKNDVYVDIDECVDGNYKVENKRAAVLQEDLDAAILDLKKEEENCRSLEKVITRKNVEMCNLKFERDETEKKIKILTEELVRRYNINVTFYQRPGIDMHGLKNFGVHIDCEENRKAFNELKEKLVEERKRHEKATRYISALTKALNDAGVEFHYVKLGADGEEVFHIDSLIDKCAKKHYEEQYNNLRDIIHERNAAINKLEKENNNLKQTLLNILEKLETKVGLCRIHLLDSYEDRANLIAVEHDRLLIKYDRLKKRINAIYGYRDTDNPCGICKNFDPKE